MIVCDDPDNCQPYGECYQRHQSGRSTSSEDYDFSPADAALVCDLLRLGRTTPDEWTREERAAVSRLHLYRQTAPARTPS